MSAVDNVKSIVLMVKKIGDMPLLNQIVELQVEIQELCLENMQLRQALADKERLLALEADLEFRDNAYWKKSDGDGPFCVPCWDDKRRLMRLTGYKDIRSCHICSWHPSGGSGTIGVYEEWK